MGTNTLWDVAYDHAQDAEEKSETWAGSFAYGAEWGTRWLVALLGMAEAIRKNRKTRRGGNLPPRLDTEQTSSQTHRSPS